MPRNQPVTPGNCSASDIEQTRILGLSFSNPLLPDATNDTRMETSRKWHAVSIIADGAACRAALALADRRYLSAEAPRLPLDGCDKPGGCQCRYRHHPDRRVGPRRAVENFRPARYWRGDEKRLISGRRSTDYSSI